MSNVPNKRDEKADYKAAYIEEYESMMRGDNKDGQERVAKILKDQYDHDVNAKPDKEPEPPVERAVPEPAETAEKTEEPVRRGPGRPRKNPE